MITDYTGVLFLDSDTDDERSDNRASRFHSFMHSCFSFESDDFEVGLLEIQIPVTWKNVRSDQYVGAFDATTNTGTLKIESGCYYNVADVIDLINREFEGGSEAPRLIYDPLFNRVRSKAGKHGGRENVHIRATKELADILGFTSSWFELKARTAENMVTFVRRGTWTSRPYVLADVPVNLQASVERLYISASIVKHRAHAQHELLRAIPAPNLPFGTIHVVTYNRPIFVPVAHSSFDRIEVCITDRNAKEPEFTRGNVVVALEFRRKRNV